jgi:hypothetical protein
MEMQGQPMPEAAPEAAPQEGGGQEQLVKIAEGMSQAMDKIAASLSEEDAAAMAQVNEAFKAVIKKAFGGGGEEEAPAPAQGQASAMGGPKGVPVGQ